jgi:hypothetical protein
VDLVRVPFKSLRPEFQNQVDNLRRKLLISVRPKTVFGREVNGAMLAELAISYCDAINSNGTPAITTAWERVVDRQCTVRRCDAAVCSLTRARMCVRLLCVSMCLYLVHVRVCVCV